MRNFIIVMLPNGEEAIMTVQEYEKKFSVTVPDECRMTYREAIETLNLTGD